jgi:hypothetical protein
VALLDHSSLPHEALQLSITPSHLGYEMASLCCNYSPSCKTGNFAKWKFLVSQTDSTWWLMQCFDSCDYLSHPLYSPDNQRWWYFDDPEDQLWRHFDESDDYCWRQFGGCFGPCDYLVTTHHDVTNDQCDDMEYLAHITDYDQVTKMTTRWQRWWRTVTDDMTNLSDEQCD